MEVPAFVRDQLTSNDFFRGGLALSAMGACALWLKSVLLSVYAWSKRHLVYTVAINDDDSMDAYYAVVEYVMHHRPKAGRSYTLSGDDKRRPTGTIVLWRGPVPLLLSMESRMRNISVGYKSDAIHSITVSGLRSKDTVDSLIRECVRWKKLREATVEGVTVYRATTTADYAYVARINPKPLDRLVLSDGALDSLRTAVESWAGNVGLYKRIGLPHKMGILLHGEPGTGKTSVAYALARHLGFAVRLCTAMSFSAAAKHGLKGSSVYLVDDVDRSLPADGVMQQELTPDRATKMLLEGLDAMFCEGQVIIVLTCNNVAAIDPAVLRPGRIDWQHRFDNPTKSMAETFMSDFYGVRVPLPGFVAGRPMSFYQVCCLAHPSDSRLGALAAVSDSHLLLGS